MEEHTELLTYQAGTEDAGKRIDVYLSSMNEKLSRSHIQKLIAELSVCNNNHQHPCNLKTALQ